MGGFGRPIGGRPGCFDGVVSSGVAGTVAREVARGVAGAVGGGGGRAVLGDQLHLPPFFLVLL